MSSSLVIFCIQMCLIQYACSQRVNGPPIVNNGLQHGSNNGIVGPIQGQAQVAAVMNGPGIAPMGPNQALGHGQITSMPNQAFASMPNQAFAGTSMPNKVYGMSNQAIAGMPNQALTAAGTTNPGYGGSGNGEVSVNGELPVAGVASVTGNVPMTGKVAFNGNVPCGGVVTITGKCASCDHNAPYGLSQMPTFVNKPYGH